MTNRSGRRRDRCSCGNLKFVEFNQCWNCFTSPKRETGEICKCGKLKRPQFELCRSCDMVAAKKEGRICDKCGNFKQANFPTCYKCAYPEPKYDQTQPATA